MATLTYVYADSTAVLGPLAASAEPHSYDLCSEHSSRLTAPRGWDVVRLELPSQAAVRPGVDDLEALANAVRDVATRTNRDRPADTREPEAVSARRSHLRAVPSAD